MRYSYYGWGPYVTVAERRRNAETKLGKLKKQGLSVEPVTIEGRTIARSFWGKSWCANLERYSDYASRLPRGRSYVRNGSVVDLQIKPGEVTAMVVGSEIYTVKIAIAPIKAKQWKAICRDCAGTVDSLVELLQGRLEKSVMDRVCMEGDGLFPSPEEIRLSCSCPDWAGMCKHVAATLYGIGARLDRQPRLLFVLRAVDEKQLLADAGHDLALATVTPPALKVLDERDAAALFGLDMADGAKTTPPAHAPSREPTVSISGKNGKKANRRNASGTKKIGAPRAARAKVKDKRRSVRSFARSQA